MNVSADLEWRVDASIKRNILQLKFASGSLVHFLSVEYSEKLKSAAAVVDDVEGTLLKFLPSGLLVVAALIFDLALTTSTAIQIITRMRRSSLLASNKTRCPFNPWEQRSHHINEQAGRGRESGKQLSWMKRTTK